MKRFIYITALLLTAAVTASAADFAEVTRNDNYVIVKGESPMQHYTNMNPSPSTLDANRINFVNVMNGVTEIGNNSFTDCVNIGDIILPSSVTKIGNQAFAGCASLTQVIIPYGVTEIGKYAFINCPNLERVYIPDTVVKYGESCFYGCPKLTIYASPNSCMRTYAENEGISFIEANGEHNVKTDVLDDVRILINGTELVYKYPVIMRDSMTYIPLRTIFEAVGASVSWNGDLKCATVTKDGNQYDFYIGSADIYTNGVKGALDKPTSLICGNTMVHIRAVEKLGMYVAWDGSSKTISITY